MDLVEGKGLSGQEARKISRECPLLLDLFLYSYLPFPCFVHSEDEASRDFTLSERRVPCLSFWLHLSRIRVPLYCTFAPSQ